MRPAAGAGAIAAMILALAAGPAEAKLDPQRIDFRAKEVGDKATIYQAEGLTLKAKCTPDGIQGEGAVEVRAISGFNNSMIHANGQYPNPGIDYFEDNDFDKGEKLEIQPYDNGVGQLIFARAPEPGKLIQIVTADYLVEDSRNTNPPYAGRRSCAFVGTALATSSRSVRPILDGATGGASFEASIGPGIARSFDCSGGILDLDLVARSNNAVVHANSQFYTPPNGAFAYAEDNAFNEATADQVQLPAEDGGSGQVLFARADGRLTTFEYLIEDENAVTGNGASPWGGLWDCGFAGLRKVTKEGSASAIDYRAGDDEPAPETIYKNAGLTLKGTCDGELVVTARSNVADAMLHAGIQGNSDVDANDYKFPATFSNGDTVSVFDTDLLPTGTAGQLVYSTPQGTHVSIDFLSAFGSPFAGSTDCAFAGVAQVSKP